MSFQGTSPEKVLSFYFFGFASKVKGDVLCELITFAKRKYKLPVSVPILPGCFNGCYTWQFNSPTH
jgi:hypothetical protein